MSDPFAAIDQYDLDVAYIPTPVIRYLLASNLTAPDADSDDTRRVVLALLRAAFTPSAESGRPNGMVQTKRFSETCMTALGLSVERLSTILAKIEAKRLIRQTAEQITVTVPPDEMEDIEHAQVRRYEVEDLQRLLGWI
jgi:hypothetical protein